LEWAGIHNVSQLRKLQQQSSEETLQKYTQLPVNRLRAALMRAAQPRVTRISPEPFTPGVTSKNGGVAGGSLLRIRGHNLMRGGPPEVRISGEKVPILQANERELLVAPLEHQMSGTLEVEIEPGHVAKSEVTLTPK
ncbi:MAG: IPT/TIG domain-containing protein, partial [bacterium]